MGIGEKPRGMDLADYVLSRFSKGEQEMMEGAYKEAADAAAVLLSQGIAEAMNRFNGKRKAEEA